ncbi:MAG: hypothetical protein L0Y71_18885 [Gemmataceae bacterium]|nr:hypothetical protein [Gemmataceae bacterium]
MRRPIHWFACLAFLPCLGCAAWNGAMCVDSSCGSSCVSTLTAAIRGDAAACEDIHPSRVPELDAALNGANGNGNGANGNGANDNGPQHIRDNAIFVEEASNQEPGIVQHVFNWFQFWDRADQAHTRDFAMSYTMELPVGSQKHQFSFTAQYLTAFEDPDFGAASQQGDVGDTFINYRYQLLANDDFLWCSPRASLILPTGDKRLGSGTGEVGYQFNLPISRYAEKFDYHFNAGFTYTPDVSVPTAGVVPLVLGFETLSPEHDLRAANLGVSAFWKPKADLHFFVEALAVWSEDIDELGSRVSSTQVLISPGVRFAVIQDPMEWVLGVAVPVGLTRDTPDIGVVAYMSIEHPFRKMKNGQE